MDTARACPGGSSPPRTCEFLPRPCPLTFSDRDSDSHERQNHQNCRNRELPGEARRGRKLWGTGSAGNRWGRGPLGVRPERRGCSGDPCVSPGLGPARLSRSSLGRGERDIQQKGKKRCPPPPFRAACQGNTEWDVPATDANTRLTAPRSWGALTAIPQTPRPADCSGDHSGWQADPPWMGKIQGGGAPWPPPPFP